MIPDCRYDISLSAKLFHTFDGKHLDFGVSDTLHTIFRQVWQFIDKLSKYLIVWFLFVVNITSKLSGLIVHLHNPDKKM